MKKVAIFHISKLGGHNKASRNLQEAFSYRSPDIDTLSINGFGYFFPYAEKIVDFSYTSLIKYSPSIWGKIYDKNKVVKGLKPYRYFLSKFAFKKLSNFIKEFKPHCFVATQAFPAGVIADFKKKAGLNTPLVSVVTDYHPHRFWIHPCVDGYIVSSQEAKDVLITEGVEEEKIKILGIPISLKFLTSYPREEICSEFGFLNNVPAVLVMGGGLGIGPIKKIVKEIDDLKCDLQTIVICGSNKTLYRWFARKEMKFKKPLFYFGYVDFVNKLMDFSDIIITKAGGITVSEALSKGMAIIITNPIPGQEEKNVDYLRSKNAIIREDDISKIGEEVEGLLTDKKTMYALKEQAKDNSFIDSSLRIVDLILETIS